MEESIFVISEIKKIITNFKKCSNRKYTKKTLIEKLKLIQEYDDVINRHYVESSIDLETVNTFKKLYTVAKDLLKASIMATDEQDSMTSFSLQTVMKTVPIFNGNYKELPPFLKIIEILYNSYDTVSKKTLLDLVINVKLDTAVRTAIGFTTTFETLNELKETLQKRYKSNLTISQIHTKLSLFQQRGNTVLGFRDKLLNLIAELNNLQVIELGTKASQVAKTTIMQMNEKYALTIFKNGLNEQFKQTIFSARPNSLADAVDIATELEKTQQTTKLIATFRANPSTDHRNLQNNQYQRNNQMQNSNYNNNRMQNNNYNNKSNNFNNNNRNSRDNNNYNNRHNYRTNGYNGNNYGNRNNATNNNNRINNRNNGYNSNRNNNDRNNTYNNNRSRNRVLMVNEQQDQGNGNSPELDLE